MTSNFSNFPCVLTMQPGSSLRAEIISLDRRGFRLLNMNRQKHKNTTGRREERRKGSKETDRKIQELSSATRTCPQPGFSHVERATEDPVSEFRGLFRRGSLATKAKTKSTRWPASGICIVYPENLQAEEA